MIMPPLTVAILASLVFQVTVLMDAFAGFTAAVIRTPWPCCRVRSAVLMLTLFTRMLVVTFTLQEAFFPFGAVAVILQVPFPIAVTRPFFTVATLLLLDFQVIPFFDALEGDTLTFSLTVFAAFFTEGFPTYTVQDALFPSDVIAVMTAFPFFFAFTLPLLTVATFLFDDFHVT